MGGKAFSSGPQPLLTPRMPLEIYTLVQTHVRSLLSRHFEHIGTPIEAPGKTSYGDVDFLVANPISALPEPKIQSLAKILGAARWISANSVYNFALPYPVLPAIDDKVTDHVSLPNENEKGAELEVEAETGEELPLSPQSPKERKLSDEQGNEEKFVQIDVHICKTLTNFNWELFHQAHGDLWNILGAMTRKQGITINDTGLYLRIPELETINRKKSLVFLSSDPDQVLDFLGLEKERWWKQFGSIVEMFEYATTCRFFFVKVDEPSGEVDDEMAVKEDISHLKANDRKRIKQRPMFKQWIEEYVPELRRKGLFLVEPIPREKMSKMALETFGDNPKAEYASRLAERRREKEREEILGVIKAAVPTPVVVEGVENSKGTQEWQYRSGVIKALKAIILGGSTEEGIVLEDGIVDGDGFYDFDKVRSFTERKWKEVGDIKWAKLQKAAGVSMRKKAEAKAAKRGGS